MITAVKNALVNQRRVTKCREIDDEHVVGVLGGVGNDEPQVHGNPTGGGICEALTPADHYELGAPKRPSK